MEDENKNLNQNESNQEQQKSNDSEKGNETPSIEELMAQVAQLKADGARNKNALDKALKEKGDITKALRAKQTAEEQEAEEKRIAEEEHKAYVKGLEDKLSLIDAKSRYLRMGMDEELAKSTAKAELDGDKETVTSNIQKSMDSLVKAKEAEWLKTRPNPQSGNGDGENVDPFLAGFNS